MSRIRALLNQLSHTPWLEHLLARVLGRFTTWPADEFARFTTSAIPATATAAPTAAARVEPQRVSAPRPEALAPDAFELRFARLQREGRYERMWSMLAEDAQRSWGGEDRFIEQMRRQHDEAELVDASVERVAIVPEWTDSRRNRTYRNVARLAVRYRFKLEWREVIVDRQVHLVPAADGWRTLCYPQAG
jgi:hypothetical protein